MIKLSILELKWATAHLNGDAWFQHHVLRRKVFIDRMAWGIPQADGAEYDQYDTPASWYILWMSESGRVQGAVRLVPTTMPYMSLDLWPEMLGGHQPKDPKVWEATRFCCDHDLGPHERARVISGLVEGCQRFGLKNGIDHYIGVMPVMIFKRSLGASGCDFEILGPTQKIEGLETGAARIPVSAKILRRIRVISLAREMKILERDRADDPDPDPALIPA
ncbi:GNAT family N-acetyltransferase [Epibacterium sp. DP7N7-1]|nr:GNAT family N-acetyltransferase [Epibacterium sp. DP7N7-1]